MLSEKLAQHIEILELPMDDHMFHEPEDAIMISEVPEHAHELPELEFHSSEPMEVCEPEDFEISLDEVPGAKDLDPEFEKMLEVSEDEDEDDKKKDKNNLAEKPMLKWDWKARLKKDGPKGYYAWAKEILDNIPKHSGYDEAGILRVISYLDRFCDENSKAMKEDTEGELDANIIEKLCAEAENGKERCEARLEKIRNSKKLKRTKKAEETAQLVKTAQKAPTVVGIVMSVPYIIGKIARICVNGMVSAGGDIEQIFDEQVKKYKLDDREQAELMMLLEDMGVPMFIDRGFLRNEDRDNTQHGFDFNGNVQA